MNFGQLLRELRLEAKMTQKQLATQIGITKSVVSYYELHENFPPVPILVKLSAIFHVSTDYLLGLEKGRSLDVSGLTEREETAVIRMVEILSKKRQQCGNVE